MNDPISGGEAKMTNTAAMVRAQNDLYMVVTNGGSEENEYGDDTLEALEEGRLTIGELQRCAMNICRFILHTPAAKRRLKTLEEMEAEQGEFSFAPVKLWTGKKETMMLKIEQAGRYKFLVRTRSALSSLAQSSSNLLLNQKPVLTIQSNGTENQWTVLKLNNIQLEAGEYEVCLNPVKAGLEIDWIEVTR